MRWHLLAYLVACWIAQARGQVGSWASWETEEAADVVAGKAVSFKFKLPISITDIIDSDAFDAAYVKDMALILAIEAKRITVMGKAAGSVIITTAVGPDAKSGVAIQPFTITKKMCLKCNLTLVNLNGEIPSVPKSLAASEAFSPRDIVVEKQCWVNSGMADPRVGVMYDKVAMPAGFTVQLLNQSKTCASEFMACESNAECNGSLKGEGLAELKNFLEGVMNTSGFGTNPLVAAVIKCAANSVPGLLVSSDYIKPKLKCAWTGPWGKHNTITGVADYKLQHGSELSAACSADGGSFVLSGCILKENCSSPPLRDHQTISKDKSDPGKPCPLTLAHKMTCTVSCTKGFHIREKKFDENKKKIKAYPQHPKCNDGKLAFDVDCEKDTDLTGMYIILGAIMILGPVPCTVKYVQAYKDYKTKVGQGCRWDSQGNLVGGSEEFQSPLARESNVFDGMDVKDDQIGMIVEGDDDFT